MDNKTSSSSHPGPQQEASNHDEFFMQQSLLFSDTIKDLKILREQLYSAAEYFEKSYSEEDQNKVVETLKDYAIKALINTIDHLGSVAYKVNSYSEEKISQFSALELRFSCLEQIKAGSPQRFPLRRPGSLLPKRALSLNNSAVIRQYPPQPWRSVSLSKYPERDGVNEIEQYSSKNKRLIKALLNMRKSRKDHTLYKYMDDI
ncbi:hypothetical protein GH714_011208 [Hevea brasiliensis]|uniref:Protein ABIL3 n=1 Tax=Hevea brasiliensis TaxID=3981 RepID=A0A6A6MMA5_HEVBR|nr:hypothetical protein GH714_011208 [Hevea brasiliensis]